MMEGVRKVAGRGHERARTAATGGPAEVTGNVDSRSCSIRLTADRASVRGLLAQALEVKQTLKSAREKVMEALG